MRRMLGVLALATLMAFPIGATTADAQTAGTADSTTVAAKKVRTTPQKVNRIALTPENTRIQFVGTHVGPKPDPRTGGFEEFKGAMELDVNTGALKSVAVQIDTRSLWTEIPKLTNHLKSADFFEVRQFPTAEFKSTTIKPMDGGKHEITGKLTLHGVTKEIKFPATLKTAAAGPILHSEFSIDRTAFDMNFGPDRVEKKVSLTVTVGEKTQPGKTKGAAGGAARG